MHRKAIRKIKKKIIKDYTKRVLSNLIKTLS
jgi:hypothetical protein